MKQIVKDWEKFCKGDNSFDDSYFYTLFMEGVTIEEIEAIYSYFPHADILIDRMRQYLFSETDVISSSDKKVAIDKLIKLDFEERRPILEKLPNFSEFNENPKFIYTDNVDSVSKLILDDIWIQDFHDFMRLQKIINDKKVYELNNALYGLTYDFDYQLFLFQPLLQTTLNTADVRVGDVLYEFKSWAPDNPNSWGSFFAGSGNSYTQFLRYLENTDKLSDLKYVFNVGKATEVQVKDAFKALFASKKQEIFDKIWNNDGFRTDLFGPIAEDLLESMYDSKLTAFEILISEKSSNFYSFIKVN